MSWIKQHERRLIYSQGLRCPSRADRSCCAVLPSRFHLKKRKVGVERSSVLPSEDASCSTSEPCVLQNVPVGTVSCQRFDHWGENRERHWYHVGRHNLHFVRCQSAVRRRKRNDGFYLFSSYYFDRFCHSERRVDNLNGRKSSCDPWPIERPCLWKLLKGLFFMPFAFFSPLNLYKWHTWIRPWRLPLLLMPSFIRNLFFFQEVI